MKRPLFSCVVPVKGPRPFMDEALASLRRQGMGDDLEIIVQDGDVEPDAGQSDALNKGFAKAHGAWLFWLNADDVLLPSALRAVERAVRQANGRSQTVDWVSGNLSIWILRGTFCVAHGIMGENGCIGDCQYVSMGRVHFFGENCMNVAKRAVVVSIRICIT